MSELIFECIEKKQSGTGVSRALKRDGRIPAVIYGFNENKMISIGKKEFVKEYEKGNLSSKLVDLKIEKKTLKVIPREIQIDPVSDNPIHVDFQLVKEDVPIKVCIRIRVLNHDKCPGIKRGGVLNIVKKTVLLICIPKNIPQFLEIDIADFEIGRNVHIKDMNLPEGVSVLEKGNFTILTIAGKVEEEAEEKEVTEEVKVAEKTESTS
jgi:large subunit ribosomal protein L25